MLIRRPLIFFTLIIAIMALFAATTVWATGGTKCPRTEGPDWSCNGVTVQGPTSADHYDCGGTWCTSYTWTISSQSSLTSPLNLIVASNLADKIVGLPADAISCDGDGGSSYFGKYLQWHCTVQVPVQQDGTAHLELAGKLDLGSTDSFLQRAYYWGTKSAWGITSGPAEPCEAAPAGGVIFEACVNWYGDPLNTQDDVSFYVTRRGDAKGCIETLQACVGNGCQTNCAEIIPDDLPANYVSSGILSGQSCDNEAVNVKTGSPFYLYEVVSGGYVFRGCLDLEAGAWTALSNCGL